MLLKTNNKNFSSFSLSEGGNLFAKQRPADRPTDKCAYACRGRTILRRWIKLPLGARAK